MPIQDTIKDAIEDLTSLEVATLTNEAGVKLVLSTVVEDGPKKEQYEAAEKAVGDAREAVLTALKGDDRGEIRKARRVLRQAKKYLSELEEALGIYDPKDIFSTIKSSMKNAKLVAYSRYELEGDSINFVNNDEDVQNLVSKHKDMVASSQEARKALFESAINVVKSLG